MESQIELKNICFQYPSSGRAQSSPPLGDFLLENLNFSIPKRKIFGITGPSGCGKSTLLKLLVSFEEPTSGELFFDGTPYNKIDPKSLRRKMVLVFQTPTLIGPSVLDDLRLGLKINHHPELSELDQDENWGRSLLKQAHLNPALLHQNPKNLSVGEALRVTLARALAIKPKVLLLDEPTAALDVDSKKAIENTLRELSDSGLTLILVSHDPDQMKRLSHHGIYLKNREIVEIW